MEKFKIGDKMKKINLNNEEKVTLALIVAVIVIAIIAVIIKIIIDFVPEKVYYAKHILVEDKKTAIEVIEKLDNGYDFCELVEEYSIDTTEKCGYVGKFKKGDMVDEFEKATKKLKYNEYTKEPIKTEYGYHIILRIKSEIKSNIANDEQTSEESSNNTSAENDVENNNSTSNNETNANGSSDTTNTNNSNYNSSSNTNNSNSSTSSSTKTEKTIEATKEYYCVNDAKLNGSQCIKTFILTPLTKQIYSCDEGVLYHNICKVTKARDAYVKSMKLYGKSFTEISQGQQEYVCKQVGGTYDVYGSFTDGTWCYVTATARVTSEYYCPDDYTLNYNNCEKYYITDAPFKLTCPSGYTLVGTSCKK